MVEADVMVMGTRAVGGGATASLTLLWVVTFAVAAGGCVTDRDWQGVRPVPPEQLAADRTLSGAQTGDEAWPIDEWWRGYGDSQLDTLIGEALQGSPSLQSAQARLRAAQAQATRASGTRLPTTTLNG